MLLHVHIYFDWFENGGRRAPDSQPPFQKATGWLTLDSVFMCLEVDGSA